MDGIFAVNELMPQISFSSETENGSNNQTWLAPLSATVLTFQVAEFLQLNTEPEPTANLNARSVAPQSAYLKVLAEDASDVVSPSTMEDGNDKRDNMPSTSSGGRFYQRRLENMRAARESSLMKIKSRTIAKPSRRGSIENTRMRYDYIKKFCTQKELLGFRPTALETIIEMPESMARTAILKPCALSANHASLLHSEPNVEDSGGVTGIDCDMVVAMGNAMDEERELSSDFQKLSMHQPSNANEDNEGNAGGARRLA